jgi:hypothetical protein
MALWGSRDTFTLTGTAFANSTVNTSILTGTGTIFSTELEVGDTIVVNGVTRKVTAIASNTSLTFEPAWTAANTAGAVTAQDSPKWLAANSATIQSSQFNGTQAIFGVDTTEAVAETTDAGWVFVNEYTDMHGNPRKKNEVLCAIGSISDDAEDAVFPDTVITIDTQPISNTAAAFSAVSFTVVTSTLPVGTLVNHRWQRAANANVAFTDLTNTGTYTNTSTATLNIANNGVAVSGSIYRVQLSAAGVTANTVSANAILTIA